VFLIYSYKMEQTIPYQSEGTIPDVGEIYFAQGILRELEADMPGASVTGLDLVLARALVGASRRHVSKTEWTKIPLKDSVLEKGSYVDEGVVYLPQEGKVLLARPGALSNYNRRMDEAHRNGEEFVLRDEEAKWYSDMAKAGNPLVKEITPGVIPVEALAQDEAMQWLFGDSAAAGKYAQLLELHGASQFHKALGGDISDRGAQPFLRRLAMTGTKDDKPGIYDSGSTHLPETGIRTIVRTEEARQAYERRMESM
jgi:hypothetical protein